AGLVAGSRDPRVRFGTAPGAEHAGEARRCRRRCDRRTGRVPAAREEYEGHKEYSLHDRDPTPLADSRSREFARRLVTTVVSSYSANTDVYQARASASKLDSATNLLPQ